MATHSIQHSTQHSSTTSTTLYLSLGQPGELMRLLRHGLSKTTPAADELADAGYSVKRGANGETLVWLPEVHTWTSAKAAFGWAGGWRCCFMCR